MKDNSQKFIENFKKGIKRPSEIFPYIYSSYQRWKNNKETEKVIKKINQENLIWHFCTPKSASTYLSYLLNINTRNDVSAVPDYNDRQQVSDFSYLYSQILENKFNNMKVLKSNQKQTISVNQQHIGYDSFLGKYISEKHIVLIQFRNIYKTVLSLKDFLISNNLINNNPFVQWDKKNYNDKDILKLIIFNYVPFHVNFIKTWSENKVRGKKIFINYGSFIKNEKNYLEKIFVGDQKKNIIIPKFETIIKKNTKFNIGIKREDTLTIDERKLIDEIVDIHTKHSDPIIKSRIYEN